MSSHRFRVRIRKDGSSALQVPLDLLEAAATPLLNDDGLVEVPVPQGRIPAAFAGMKRSLTKARDAGAVAPTPATAATDETKQHVRAVPVLRPAVLSGGVEEPKYMKKKDFARRHSVSTSTINYWLRCGLPTNGIKGQGIRIKVRDGDAWVEAGGPALAGKGRR